MDTTDFGWPMSSPVKTVGSKIYLEARKGLSPFGYFSERQCKKGAFKQIEVMLKQYGLTDDDIYLDRNSRSFISAVYHAMFSSTFDTSMDHEHSN